MLRVDYDHHVADAFKCTCVAGYSGVLCATDNNECASSPCLHGGTCSQGVNSYTCTRLQGHCRRHEGSLIADKELPGYTGTLVCTCLAELDQCASDPCLDKDTCFDHVLAYTPCVCIRGYAGFNCEIDVSDCLSRRA